MALYLKLFLSFLFDFTGFVFFLYVCVLCHDSAHTIAGVLERHQIYGNVALFDRDCEIICYRILYHTE